MSSLINKAKDALGKGGSSSGGGGEAGGQSGAEKFASGQAHTRKHPWSSILTHLNQTY